MLEPDQQAGPASSSARGARETLSRRFIGQVPAQISHLRLTREEAEDVCQTLAERLFVGRGDTRPRIAEYSGRGPLLGWIRMAAIREALDRRRSQKALIPEDDPQRSAGLARSAWTAAIPSGST